MAFLLYYAWNPEVQPVLVQPLVLLQICSVTKCSSTIDQSKNCFLWLCCRFILLFIFWGKGEQISQICVWRFYQRYVKFFLWALLLKWFPMKRKWRLFGFVPDHILHFQICSHMLWKYFQVNNVRAPHELHTCADNWAEEISESSWGVRYRTTPSIREQVNKA